MVAGGIVLASRGSRGPATGSHAGSNPNSGSGSGSSGTATNEQLLDYLRNVSNILEQSGSQRTQVRDAIAAKDAATLDALRQRRLDLAATVRGWSVPGGAEATNRALVEALTDSAAADAKWASYARGGLTFAEAKSFENSTVHQAKFRFDALYDQLLATVRGGPSPVPTNFLF